MGTQKDYLNETILFSTHNLSFGQEIRKMDSLSAPHF